METRRPKKKPKPKGIVPRIAQALPSGLSPSQWLGLRGLFEMLPQEPFFKAKLGPSRARKVAGIARRSFGDLKLRTGGGSASKFRAGGPAETKRFTAKKRTTRKPPYR
jgi:hypothetical protein